MSVPETLALIWNLIAENLVISYACNLQGFTTTYTNSEHLADAFASLFFLVMLSQLLFNLGY